MKNIILRHIIKRISGWGKSGLTLMFFVIISNVAFAQCCGDGVCDPGETNCIDCPQTPGFNCPNTDTTFFVTTMNPGFPGVNLATATDSGWCYTYTAPFPSQLCFEYQFPNPDANVGLSLLINSCSSTNVVMPIVAAGGSSNFSFVFDPSVISIQTFDNGCNLIGNNVTTGTGLGGVPTGILPGDIVTVCINFDVAEMASCSLDTLRICPVFIVGNANVSPPLAGGCPPANFTTDSTAVTCTGNLMDGTATVTPACGSHFTYLWDDPLAQTDSNAVGLAPGVYEVQITNTAYPSCIDTLSVTIDTAIYPVAVVLLPDTLTCVNPSVILDGTGSSSGASIAYNWSTTVGNIVSGATSLTSTVDATGEYVLTVTDAINGCSASNSGDVLFTNSGGPTAYFGATPTNGIAPLEVMFSDSSSGNGLTYFWDLGDGATSTLQNPTTTYTEAGTYNVILTVTDSNGCVSTYGLDVIVEIDYNILIPNIFSPNGDGSNDLFNVQLNDYNTFHIQIYNRWGQLLFETNLPNHGWDGRTTAGELVPDATYFYLIEVVDRIEEEHQYKGFLTLIR